MTASSADPGAPRSLFVDFIDPNEEHPNVAEAIYRASNHGVYLSVGTERSFMGAAYTRAAMLYVVDVVPELVRFARINAALLEISTSLADYVSLRQEDPAEAWSRRVTGADADVRQQLGDPANWAWWEQIVRRSHLGFKDVAVEPRAIKDPFYGFDYLFDEDLYAHLHRLAVAGRICASVVDLGKAEQTETVLQAIAATGMPLGIVDGSNVSDSVWLGGKGTARYILQMRPYAVPDTLFLNTTDYPQASCNWSYFAFTSAYLDAYPTMDSLGDLVDRTRQALQVPDLRAVLDEVDLPVPYRDLPAGHKTRPRRLQADGA